MNKNDRGMKWNGFFMPETIKMLKDIWMDDHKTPRPHLDETKLDEMERLLSESMATKIPLEITTWTNGFYNSHVGFVLKINPFNKRIQLQDEFETNINLNFFSITNVMVK